MRTVFLPFFIERWNIQKYHILWLVLQKEENFITKTFKTNKTSGRWQSPVGATRTQAGDVSPCDKKKNIHISNQMYPKEINDRFVVDLFPKPQNFIPLHLEQKNRYGHGTETANRNTEF